MKLDWRLINEMVEKGYIARKKHPKYDLELLSYTNATQIDRKWNKATIMCRGLIVDSGRGDRLVAMPLKKFFTLDQISAFGLRSSLYQLYDKVKYSELFQRPFNAYEKVDGSLGIIFYNPYTKVWDLASRGSFESEQAIEGQKMLAGKDTSNFKIGKTYMVEIIYPENRIVVDYGARRDLSLLAVIDNETGKDDWKEWTKQKDYGWNTPHLHTGLTYLSQLESVKQSDDDEGFVLVWPGGFRLKFKFDEYLRLHKIMTQVTSRNVWMKLKKGESIKEWLKDVPDEFYVWVESVVKDLNRQYDEIEAQVTAMADDVQNRLDAGEKRGTVFHSIDDVFLRGLAFAELDGRDNSKKIWGKIKPAADKPFAFQEVDGRSAT